MYAYLDPSGKNEKKKEVWIACNSLGKTQFKTKNMTWIKPLLK